ncbi:MAG: Wzz/FepE/Etk N-terminal domain-containing protein, partial [bacterium]
MSDTIRFVDFVLPLARRRRLIVLVVLVAAVASVVASLLWPKTWRATVTLLPPERRMDNPGFIPGSFEGLGASLRGVSLRHVATPTDIFLAILDSRNVAEALVTRLGLQEEFGVKSMQSATRRLQKSTRVAVTQDGTIRIEAFATSPERAANLANAYVEEL